MLDGAKQLARHKDVKELYLIGTFVTNGYEYAALLSTLQGVLSIHCLKMLHTKYALGSFRFRSKGCDCWVKLSDFRGRFSKEFVRDSIWR